MLCLAVLFTAFWVEEILNPQLSPRIMQVSWCLRRSLHLGVYLRAGSSFEFRKRSLEFVKLAVVVCIAFSGIRHGR